ncbi:hypothetical protein R1sor_027030 [Riccia sorocarpa]|uniref:Uncharacterized protein n=1 Tax=Riccia sorocarpa TaxID=122646 RepID=A0ABD3GET0_9MARC
MQPTGRHACHGRPLKFSSRACGESSGGLRWHNAINAELVTCRGTLACNGSGVLHVKDVLHVWMAFPRLTSAALRHSGTKRSSPNGDRLPEAVKERLLHMELENGFLEEQVRLLEEECRKYRLRIDELRAELRERTDELLQYKNRVAEYNADIREQLEANDAAWAKIRSLIDENKAFRRQIDENSQPDH